MNLLNLTIQESIYNIIPKKFNTPIQQEQILILDTPNLSLGHKSTSIAFVLAKILKTNPMLIAQQLIEELKENPLFTSLEAVNGYINMFISPGHLFNFPKDFNSFSINLANKNLEKIHLEFVSANPTGPLHIGHGRWAVLGDSLARILKRVGYSVHTEFYVNDAGSQIQKLKESVLAVKEERSIPEDGYHGEYIYDIAKQDIDPVEYFIAQHKDVLKSLGVQMDTFFSEKSLYTSHSIETVLTILKDKGLLFEDNGATFFKTTEFGDDKDRAIIKADGTFTYFTPDIAYHYTKILGNYNWLINILGADHHGYVPRISAAVQALSNNKVRFTTPLGQLVKLVKNGDPLKMSKRAGNIIELSDVINEIGIDAIRIILLSKKFNHTIEFDLEVLKEKNKDNPIFYIQYAHARICSILNSIDRSNATFDRTPPQILEDTEIALTLHIQKYTEVLKSIVESLDPYFLYAYLYDLASLFHKFYEKIRIKNENHIIFYRIELLETLRSLFTNIGTLLGVGMPTTI